MRAALYARVSSAAQRDRHTVASQLRDGQAWIASQGWQLVEVYVDDGRSAAAGKLEARTEWARLLAEIRPRAVEVVVAVAVDRLTRSEDPVERAQVIASVTDRGARLAIVGAGVQDVGTFAGDAYVTLQALFAAEENRRRRERVIAGHRTAAERGRKPRGWTPYGLTYDAHRDPHGAGGWGVDEPAAAVVVEILGRVADGEPSGRIAADLEARGVARPGGGRWSSERVRAIVRSDVYLGRYVVDAARGLSVPVPTIADLETVEAARAVLDRRYRRPPTRTRYHHLLTGLAVCGLCRGGVGLAGSTDRATGRQPTCYRCLHRRAPLPGTEPCRLPLHRTAAVDELAWRAVGRALSEPEVLDRWLAASRVDQPEAGAVEKAEAELSRLDRAQDSVLAHLVAGRVGQEIADAQIARLAKQRHAAQAALRDARAVASRLRPAADPAALAETLRLVQRGLACAPAEERPGLLRALVGRVVLGPGELHLDLAVPCASRVGGSSGCPVAPVWARIVEPLCRVA